MATLKQTVNRLTGADRANQYKKSARTSARVFAQAGVLGSAARRRKSLGGKGG